MRDQISIFITCIAPLEGYVKLNVDGTAMGNPWLAGFDGIFRDKAGNFKLAFAKTISYITNAMAEMKEVHHRKLELLLLDGLALAQGFEALQLHFVYREANFAADALAKYAYPEKQELLLASDHPQPASYLLPRKAESNYSEGRIA
ncbi:hypothetical protein CsSME_00045848 [Camellia sinensis var. sinensis]